MDGRAVPQAANALEHMAFGQIGLRKAVSDLTLEKLILKEAASGNY